MTILSDNDIATKMTLGQLAIEPFNERNLQPASIDLTLGDYLTLRNGHPVLPDAVIGGWMLLPKQFVLGVTREHIMLDEWHCAELTGKSTIGRMGLAIHITAGHVDPGFRGYLTLEICNLSNEGVIVKPGDPVCQLIFHELSSKSTGYRGRYQNQGPYPEPARKVDDIRWEEDR